jgi:hypothetical protein
MPNGVEWLGKGSQQMSLADQLRKAVTDSGLSVYRIAKDSGVSQAVLQRFITGDRKNIRIDTADKVATFFQMRLTPPRFPKE